MVYEEAGHTNSWTVHGNSAFGSPLIGNRDIEKLRRAHRIHLARLGIITTRALPLIASIVADHAAKYWYKGSDSDILLNAIFVTGLNLGLRYDEVQKISMNYVTVTSDGITLGTDCSVKNQTGQRSYEIEEWPGENVLRGSIYMDLLEPLLSWLTVRGPSSGFLFCDVSSTKKEFAKFLPLYLYPRLSLPR